MRSGFTTSLEAPHEAMDHPLLAVGVADRRVDAGEAALARGRRALEAGLGGVMIPSR